MLIGEAPGAEEDRQGKPFVGPSGQLLDRMLATIGLGRDEVYITNVIFWRPPGNRAPTTLEIATCQPFLERQIELLRPGVIVFVGGIAARALLGRADGVTRLRGRRFEYRMPGLDIDLPALVMLHPAFLLRQPLQKKLAWRDLLQLRAILDEQHLMRTH
jgi:DNA polymerase